MNQQHQTKCASWRHAVLKESQRAPRIDRHHGVKNAVDESQHQIVALGESVLTGGDEVEGVPEHAGSERTQESQARNGDGAGGLVAVGGHGLARHGASVRRIPCYTSAPVRVAQLDRALPSEGKGCRFDSRHGRFREGPDCRGSFA